MVANSKLPKNRLATSLIRLLYDHMICFPPAVRLAWLEVLQMRCEGDWVN